MNEQVVPNCIDLAEISLWDKALAGGKALSLGQLMDNGFNVPGGFCITTKVYYDFLTLTGLDKQILLELHRKSISEMRWEELWDASLRIRNLFLKTPVPPIIASEIKKWIQSRLGNKNTVIRSSSLEEDSAKSSFAGLHESYVNIQGIPDILDRVILVWASLWSDRALLYRKELGLDVLHSKMAVIVQEFIDGEKSGVAFGISPFHEQEAIIECVYGLNQGLVDGVVAPDRWILDRETGRVISYTQEEKDFIIKSVQGGKESAKVEKRKIDPGAASSPPLSGEEIGLVFDAVKKSGEIHGGPQDMEWTFASNKLYILQSRPVTFVDKDEGEGKIEYYSKKWYLSLHKSFDSLIELREKIEAEIVPGMIQEALSLSKMDLQSLSNKSLAAQLIAREEMVQKWEKTYWDYLIPYAHGFRLFGEVYNDKMKPHDPYEFIDLLSTGTTESMQRNQLLSEVSRDINENENLKQEFLTSGKTSDSTMNARLEALFKNLGYLDIGTNEKRKLVLEFLGRLDVHPGKTREATQRSIASLEKEFLSSFPAESREFGKELLDLGRHSYKMRDDDNIYLENIKKERNRCLNEILRRVKSRLPDTIDKELIPSEEMVKMLHDSKYSPQMPKKESEFDGGPRKVFSRQVKGQPACKGIIRAKARVIRTRDDLLEIKPGEIIVCDSIDPNMTFAVPLCSGIVERRGGMLVHGAIIAREYTIPCVTGIPGATEIIQTGNEVTVNGYLGIIIIHDVDVI